MANDAMAWSINIHDHYDLDTSTLPLQGLALLDRLVFRREYERALAISDSLLDTLRGHTLGDDLYMRRASLLERLGRYVEADSAYGSVLANFGDEVWADDACLRRGGLWETHLGDSQRARDLYEKLMLKYPESAFVPEARKRIRKIRGDRSPDGS
jgi:tetratricopeptide (TPR) repeat protein